MIKIIDKCFKNAEIASYFFDCGNTQMQLVGYVHLYNNSEILLAHVSRHGNYDGFILKHIEDICRIDHGGDYENKIKKLYQLKNQTHSNIKVNNPNTEILYSLLEFAAKHNLVVSLELLSQNVSGFIKEFDDDTICLRVLDDIGRDDGFSINRIDDVITVAVDTDDEQDLKVLAERQSTTL